METSNKALHKIFAAPTFSLPRVRKYRLGDKIPLEDLVGLVLGGVAGCDSLSINKEAFVTLRLAGEGSLLNLGQYLASMALNRQFICETPIAVVAVMDCKAFKQEVTRLALHDTLLLQFSKHEVDAEETALYLSSGTSYDKVLWAIRRYQKSTKSTGDLPVLKSRLAAHAGVTIETVSRALSQMVSNGELTERTNSNLKLKEAS